MVKATGGVSECHAQRRDTAPATSIQSNLARRSGLRSRGTALRREEDHSDSDPDDPNTERHEPERSVKVSLVDRRLRVGVARRVDAFALEVLHGRGSQR